MLDFNDAEIRAKAAELGLVYDGHTVPAHLRSRVAAAIVEERRGAAKQEALPPATVAQSISVQPGIGVEIDGAPFPWIVQADHVEVTLAPDGSGLVRLTIPTNSVVIKPRESE